MYADTEVMLKRLYAWWTQKSVRDLLLETLAQSRLYEEWEGAAFQLDQVLGYDLWSDSRIPCASYSPLTVRAGARTRRASTTITVSSTNDCKASYSPAMKTIYLG